MNIKKIKDQLIRHEGLKLKPYQCPADRLTIGVGRNLEDKGITEKEALMLLENDIQECLEDLKTIFDKFDMLPESAQHVLVDMRFNLGHNGFRKFKNMIKAVKNQDFHSTAREMRDSRWYHQVGKRAERLTEMMEDSKET